MLQQMKCYEISQELAIQ